MKARHLIILFEEQGRKRFEYRVPHRILPNVRSAVQLRAALAVAQEQGMDLTTLDVSGRRRFIEQVRPALRWFCREYEVAVPEWLVGDGLTGFSPQQLPSLLGARLLRVIEFEPASTRSE